MAFAFPWLGLTQATYHRLICGLCPTTLPKTLPLEFRPANQRRLDELERLVRELDAKETGDTAAESRGVAGEDAES
eukprot:4247438-Pleurochrysis_carterae.AAC.1